MGQVITKLRIETDEYQNRVRRAAASLSDMAHQCEVAGNRISVSNKHNIALVQSLGSMQTASTTLRGKVSELSAAFIDASHSYNQLTSHEKRTQYGEALSASIDKLKTRLREAQNELRSLENEASGKSSIGGVTFGQKFMQGLVPGLGMGVGAAGALVAVQLTQKAFGLMKETMVNTINENKNFEQSNANLAAVLGKTRDEIGALTENAKQLGATTFYTAGQITELQTVLARLGFTQSQILAMTKDISNLAIATGTDLSQAAQLAGSTMRAFGMKASEMDRITSVLGVSTTKSALTTEALATALQYVATDATNAGFSLEDTVAMLGTLMNNGIRASTAGTSLRQILIQMSADNGKLAKAFGTTVHSLDEFAEAIQQVKTQGVGTISYLSDKVRVTARSSLLALGANIEKAQELRDQITDVGEELQKMADTQLNTLQGSVTLMQSAWNGLMLTFEESNSTLKKTADWLTEVINKAVEWRKLKNGGESALSLFTKEPNKALAESRFEQKRQQAEANLTANGTLAALGDDKKAVATAISEEIKRLIDEEVKKLEVLDSDYQRVQDSIDEIPDRVGFFDDQNAALQAQYGRLDKLNAIHPLAAENQYGVVDWSTQLLPTRGALRTDIGTWKYAIGLADAMVSNDVFSDGTDETTEEKILNALQSGKKTPAETAAELVENAIRRYDEELRELQNRLDRGMIDRAGFDKGKLGLDERVFEAYNKANTISPAQKYADGVDYWVGIMKGDADLAQKSGATKKMIQSEEKYARTYALADIQLQQGLEDEMAVSKKKLGAEEALYGAYSVLYDKTKDPKYLEEMDLLAEAIKSWRGIIREQEEELRMRKDDEAILGALETVAKRNGKNMSAKQLGDKSVFEYFGLTDMRERMNADLTLDITPEEWQKLVDEINEKLAALKLPKIELDIEAKKVTQLTNQVKDMATQWGYVTSAIGSVGQALNTIEDPGAKVAGTIAQAVATIAMGFATASAASSKFGVFPWIAATAAGIATLASTVASIKSITAEYHAEGGFVGGGPRGTDTVNTWLTPGELVLNRAQQNTLAAQLQPARVAQPQQSTPYVTGEVMWLGLNNYLRRTGRGEIVTSRR